MSGMLKKYKKNVGRFSLRYDSEMYSTPYGSIVICALMFTPEDKRPSVAWINKRWKSLKRKSLKGANVFPLLSDENFIMEMLRLFELEKPELFPVAMVQSSWNMLFAPYVDGKLLSIREDGFISKTLENGKIYPIEF